MYTKHFLYLIPICSLLSPLLAPPPNESTCLIVKILPFNHLAQKQVRLTLHEILKMKHNFLEIKECLIAGANPLAKNSDGKTALEFAIELRQIQAIQDFVIFAGVLQKNLPCSLKMVSRKWIKIRKHLIKQCKQQQPGLRPTASALYNQFDQNREELELGWNSPFSPR